MNGITWIFSWQIKEINVDSQKLTLDATNQIEPADFFSEFTRNAIIKWRTLDSNHTMTAYAEHLICLDAFQFIYISVSSKVK